MSLRIGIDLDGTLADLSSAYHRIEQAIFGDQLAEVVTDGDETADAPGDAEEVDPKEKIRAARAASARSEQVWRVIRAQENFWTTLGPTEPGIVRRLYLSAMARQWEVFFVTQRPRTAGDSVQHQTQRWLIEQGYEAPSVLTLSGSRGRAAAALEWGFLIDDLPKNCVDVVSDSKCRPILVLRRPDPAIERSAAGMSIAVASSVAEALDRLENPESHRRPSAVRRIMKNLGLG